jgi:uncharacterized membrane protein
MVFIVLCEIPLLLLCSIFTMIYFLLAIVVRVCLAAYSIGAIAKKLDASKGVIPLVTLVVTDVSLNSAAQSVPPARKSLQIRTH